MLKQTHLIINNLTDCTQLHVMGFQSRSYGAQLGTLWSTVRHILTHSQPGPPPHFKPARAQKTLQSYIQNSSNDNQNK